VTEANDWLDLANDPNVDLVVCCTRVDRHLDPLRPSIMAGKKVYVEWPMEKNFQVAQEMAALARKYNAKTVVGLQASFAPAVRKLKLLIEGGAIGRVLSSDYNVAVRNDLFTESKNMAYFLDRSVGGGSINIHTAHNLECISAGKNPAFTYCSFSLPFYRLSGLLFPCVPFPLGFLHYFSLYGCPCTNNG
jgi:predicted dehydrogenase